MEESPGTLPSGGAESARARRYWGCRASKIRANLSEHLTQLKPDAVSNSGDSLSLGPGAETAETRKPLLW